MLGHKSRLPHRFTSCTVVHRGLQVLPLFASIISLTAAPKLLPVLRHPLADRSGLAGTSFTVDLASAFGTEPIDDQIVRFTSQINSGETPLVLDMAMFSNLAPVTRENFLKYVTDGDYLNSFIHRSVPGFVIQGGGFRLVSGNIEYIPTDPPIMNEFGVSNTLGTISMAKGNDPDSATSQWFVSTAENSDNLDHNTGGFTVFARMTQSTLINALIFGNPSYFPIYNFNSPFGELPLFYTYETDPSNPLNYLISFPNVSLEPLPAGQAGEDPTLIYSVVSNSNSAVASASILPDGVLNLSPVAGMTGSTLITVRATDSVGNTVDDNLVLTVNLSDSYSTWVSRNTFPGGQDAPAQDPDADGWNNLQEYAFLGDPAHSNNTSLTVFPGIAAVSRTARYMTLTFPVRKATIGLSYAVEANDLLSGKWTEIWKSSDSFEHPQVVSAVDEADRTVLTVRDTVEFGTQSKRFLRTRVVQD